MYTINTQSAFHAVIYTQLFPVHLPVRYGQDGDGEGKGEEGTEADDYTHRHPETRMGDNHRQDTECRGGGGEEDRMHTPHTRFVSRLAHAISLMAQLLCVLVHHYRIADNHTYQAHDTQYRRYRDVQSEHIQPHKCPEDTQYRTRQRQHCQ